MIRQAPGCQAAGIHSINHPSIRVPNFDSEPCGKSESNQENLSEKMQQIDWILRTFGELSGKPCHLSPTNIG